MRKSVLVGFVALLFATFSIRSFAQEGENIQCIGVIQVIQTPSVEIPGIRKIRTTCFALVTKDQKVYPLIKDSEFVSGVEDYFEFAGETIWKSDPCTIEGTLTTAQTSETTPQEIKVITIKKITLGIPESESWYYCGFESKIQIKDWTRIRTDKSVLTESNWSVHSGTASHDYYPGADDSYKQIDDWFISPPFSLGEGAQIDTLKYLSVGMMPRIIEGDTIGIYALYGSADPRKASKKVLLLDIRGEAYPYQKTEYTVKTNIALPPSQEPCHIAFRYKNQEYNTRWYTLRFDDLWLSGIKKLVHIEAPKQAVKGDIEVYPNPTSDIVTIRDARPLAQVLLMDFKGVRLHQSVCNTEGSATLSVRHLPKGVYLLYVGERMCKLVIN